MAKTRIAKGILIFIFSVGALVANAQDDFNFKKYAVGAEVSYIRGYTNVNRQDNHFAEALSFTYYLTPFIPLSFEVQKGTLSGGGLTVDLDKYGRKYTNNYFAAMLHGDFQMGQIIDPQGDVSLNILKGLYAGLGVGLIDDNCTTQRYNVIAANGPITGPDVYKFPGTDKSLNLMVPVRIGYEYKITNNFDEPIMRVFISYTHSFVFGEGLDGYDDPASHFKNNSLDQYRQITLGVKFDFGGTSTF